MPSSQSFILGTANFSVSTWVISSSEASAFSFEDSTHHSWLFQVISPRESKGHLISSRFKPLSPMTTEKPNYSIFYSFCSFFSRLQAFCTESSLLSTTDEVLNSSTLKSVFAKENTTLSISMTFFILFIWIT